jgi:probable HAF family extracellular repeat protein
MSYLVKYTLKWGLSRRLVRSVLIASAVVGGVTASLSLVAAAPARSLAKPQGTCGVVDLTPPGTSAASATAINDRGQVAGVSSGSPSFGSFLWQDGGFTDLGAGADSAALGLNDRGQVVGFEAVGISRHAFLWENGVLRDLGNFGFFTADADDINNRGQVAGGHDHAFLWENGAEHDLGTLGGRFSGASAINDRGQVVGISLTSNDESIHAFLWDNGAMRDLSTLVGDAGHSEARDINNRGDVVGFSTAAVPGDSVHPVIWPRGDAPVDLQPLAGFVQGGAQAINDRGDVVGVLDNNDASSDRAFLIHDGAMVDLNACLPPNSGWILSIAFDISNRGEIVGAGFHNGVQSAFLLTTKGAFNGAKG